MIPKYKLYIKYYKKMENTLFILNNTKNDK